MGMEFNVRSSARLLISALGFFLSSSALAQNHGFTIESIEPFVHEPRIAPAALDVPRNVTITFRAAYPTRGSIPGTVHSFQWTGATEIMSGSTSSVARRQFSTSGTYVVRVSGDGGTLQGSITIQVGALRARSLKIGMIDPSPGSREVGHIKTPWPCKARINHPEYEHLIEWRASGNQPIVADGAVFTPTFRAPGKYELSVGPDPTQSATFDIYEVTRATWNSPWGEAIWYGLPITFIATTNPPGYESYVTWNVDTMHDMHTRADPPTGLGARFTTTLWPTAGDQLFWAQIYSSNLAVLAQTDVKPPASGPLGGNDGLESPGRGCQMLDDGNLPRGPTTKNTGDVYLHSGEYFLEQVDLRIKGRGFDFVWKRKYRSREGRNTVMGWNWDFSYNIRVQTSADNPADRWVYSGDSRRDTYKPTGTGCWNAEGLFSELCQDVGGSYVLTFPNMTKWKLQALDGSLTAGAILAITDRNQNTMTFAYDPAGRLATITDTVGHSIQITYTPDGHIAAVSGPLGHQVTYAYYAAGAAGGSAGDLMSWTSAPVVGTVTQNDFTAGKTITYTYSVGLPQVALLHNLTSITDALHQVFLVNVYTTTTDPAAKNFDRLDHQIFTDGPIYYWYGLQTPTAANGMATTRTIIRDRALNVREAFFNARNQMVIQREYTGRALDASRGTTDLDNRPIGQLRAGDPPYYETRGVCSADSLRTSITLPCGNEVDLTYTQDLSPTASRREQANLRTFQQLPGPRGGDQAQISRTFDHLPGFGSCCGESFVTREVDGRTHETLHTYDSAGNRLHTQHRIAGIVEDFEYNTYGQLTAYVHSDNGSGIRRRDVQIYNATGPSTGYLQERHTDVLGRDLRVQLETDAVGNVTRVIDASNQDTSYSVNALDQVVRQTSREPTPGSGIRYQHDTIYDAENHVVRLDVQNRDETGAIQPNAAFSTSFVYDILGRMTQKREEVDATHEVARNYSYDANGNPREEQEGESVAGRQPANRVSVSFDERDLAYRETVAPGDPLQSTSQYDYDCNRNLARVLDGIEATPRVSQFAYDGYDRLASASDPLQNQEGYHYDANHNVSSIRVDGEVTDVPGSTGNVRLFEVANLYDDMDRPTSEDVGFFDPATQSPFGDGHSITTYEYSPASQVTRVTDDRGSATQTVYDSTLEVSGTIDPKGNRIDYTYDRNQNVTSMLETERSDDGGPDQVFRTDYVYDGLDRLTRITDSSQNIIVRAYDSRHNMTRLTDALGNITRFTFDGLSRLLTTTLTLTDTGDGSGVAVGTIAQTQTWDDDSRLLRECDGLGHCTGYTYNPSNRVIRTDYADGRFETREYDVYGNAVRVVDPNGTVVVSDYDGLDGLLDRTITPGAGVASDTTFETYEYDGLSRLIRATNDRTVVTRTYDSLSNVTQETANGLSVSWVHDSEGNETQTNYPGGRNVQATYDGLDRKLSVTDQAGTVASYAYVGPGGRVLRRDLGNGTRSIYAYDGLTGVPNPAGDHGVKRLVRLTSSSIATGVAFDDRTFAWDGMGDRLRQDNALVTLAGQPRRRDLAYDSSYRLRRTTSLDGTLSVLSVSDYTLDSAGNRTTVSGPDGGAYTMSPTLPEPGDAQMNQYSSTPFDTRGYDADGNLISTQTGATTRTLKFDYRNLLVAVSEPATGLAVQYVYDVFGRRLEKREGAVTPVTTARYVYDEAQEIVEADAAGVPQATFVYGNDGDELLSMRRGGADYYYHSDDQNDVLALTNAAGSVVERYEYGDFGRPTAPSVVGNPYLFSGRRYDADTGLYYYRARYFDPSVGRFISRDPRGIWSDSENIGNPLTYAANNPWSRTDPTGEATVTFNGCAGQEEMIKNRIDEAEALARRSYDHLARRSGFGQLCDSRYITWFGLPIPSLYKDVERIFSGIRDRLSGSMSVDCSNTGCRQKVWGVFTTAAFVGGSCNSTVCVCGKWFHPGIVGALTEAEGVPTTPEIQAGILVHEFSHLEGTMDYAYSGLMCYPLARINPWGAVHNADNYRLFATGWSGVDACLGLRTFGRFLIRAAREAVDRAGRFGQRAERKAKQAAKTAIHKAEDAVKQAVNKVKKLFRR